MTTTTTTTANSGAAQAADAAAAGKARSATAGFSDGLGDRQLVFDPAAAASFELLQFKKEFADVPEFEAALRARVEDVRNVQHPSLTTIQGVERRADGALLLASKLVSGRRVSELIPKARGAAFAIELIRLITPALAVLHKSGDRIAHGALTPDRIIVTRDGRLMIVEHALGSAIESLKLSRSRLNEIGLAVTAGEHARLDARNDMAQLGYLALSLLLGRQLDPVDFPVSVPTLLDEFVMSSSSPMLSAKMRAWLERAMQISPRSFASAKEASDALGDLPDDADVRASETNLASMPTPPKPMPIPTAAKSTRQAAAPAASAMAASERSKQELPDFLSPKPASSGGGLFRAPWMTTALAVLAGVEGVAIAALLYTRPAAEAAATQAAAQVAAAASLPQQSPVVVATPSPIVPSPSPVAASPSPAPAKAEALAAAAPAAGAAAAAVAPAGPRFGGITVSSPIELKVFKDGTLLGTTGGPIAVSEGAQSLQFVNETLGFRTVQTVTVKFGQMTAVKIGVPNGRISINAIPWAEVTIDGTAHGETPIANLALPIGTHEIVFKHPQLGEKRRTVIVKVDELLRVTETLDPAIQR